ncbi:DUF1839 family protein [Aureimonas psammosilenae]|uniref:DUF1839 family protein n=1 Tax=Aureimonas psammosilenae TaxID=2495496 RepID=UPI001260B713|nr:DUF1839 family protein [Aureimonas psammosilenae]
MASLASRHPTAVPNVWPAFQPHSLHAADRVWPETNCYVDLWIELLNHHGFLPEAMLGFTLRQDFEGDQFTFFKPGMADIERLYGLRLEELAIHESLERHAEIQTRAGRVVLVEVDAIHLPDTAGTTYGREHSKTTIGIFAIDPVARSLDYLHNAGRFRLDGADYEGVFAASLLPPYAEFVKRTGEPMASDALPATALGLLSHHLAAAPRANPVHGFRAALREEAPTLVRQPLSVFHRYAFHTTRQLGANFELLGSHLAWLDATGAADLGEAAALAGALAQDAKAFQFHLARGFGKKSADGLETRLDGAAARYDALFASLRRVVA